MMINQTITAVEGIRVGHWTDNTNLTGCTVILCPPATVGGVDQRGGAPGTRETDLLRPMHIVEHIHGVMLAGGSAFGLRAADGVMAYLKEQNIGFPTRSGVSVPIVPAAILYDLEMGKPEAPPVLAGYDAAEVADAGPVTVGNVGAGIGCAVGKIAGMARATKTGLGTAIAQAGDLMVGALFAVNALGDIIGAGGEVIAGLRQADDNTFGSTLAAMQAMQGSLPTASNTVIGVVATNAKLTKPAANKVAQMAQNGLARAVLPAHTMYDGDTIFSLATGQIEADTNLVGALAAQATTAAIRGAAVQSTSLGSVKGTAT